MPPADKHPGNSILESSASTSTESLPIPDRGISRADSLPSTQDDHAGALSQLQVSDGDFHTKARVNGMSAFHT